MNVRAARAGLVIREIPSHEHRRLHGISNLKIVRDGIRIGKFIFRERFASRTARNARVREVDVQEIPYRHGEAGDRDNINCRRPVLYRDTAAEPLDHAVPAVHGASPPD